MLIKMWKARRARLRRERVDRCKEVFRTLSRNGRDTLRDRMTIEACSGYFRNEGLVDMSRAAVEVIDEEIAAIERTGKTTLEGIERGAKIITDILAEKLR